MSRLFLVYLYNRTQSVVIDNIESSVNWPIRGSTRLCFRPSTLFTLYIDAKVMLRYAEI